MDRSLVRLPLSLPSYATIDQSQEGVSVGREISEITYKLVVFWVGAFGRGGACSGLLLGYALAACAYNRRLWLLFGLFLRGYFFLGASWDGARLGLLGGGCLRCWLVDQAMHAADRSPCNGRGWAH